MTMNAYSGTELRRKPRAPFPFELWYRDRNRDGRGFKHAYGKNISECGVLFEAYEDFPLCTILELKLELPPSGYPGFNILGEVVRTGGIKKQWLFYIGVSFCSLPDELKEDIKGYVASQPERKYNHIRDPLVHTV